MSVEKVGALNQSATDATTMRPVNGFGTGHGRTPAPFPPPTAPNVEGAPHLYDSLVLPLPDGAAADVPTSRISASYRTEAARELIEPLIDGRLPEPLIRREVETLLRRLADARRIDETDETAPERLPSRNAADAHFDVKGRLAPTEEDGKIRLFDLYLTRIGPRQWEAAVFERDPSRASQTFPRPTPPVETHRLLFDPTTGLVLACVAQKLPSPFTPDVAPGRGAGRAAAYAAFAVILALLVARVVSWPAAAIVLAAVAALTLW